MLLTVDLSPIEVAMPSSISLQNGKKFVLPIQEALLCVARMYATFESADYLEEPCPYCWAHYITGHNLLMQ